MKNLESLIAATKRDLDALEVPYRTVRHYTVNTRAKRRWGLCKTVSPGVFDIEISARILEDGIPDQTVKNVLAHELLHTVPDCFAHRGPWKAWCRYIQRELPQYCIKTTNSDTDMGVSPAKTARYRVECTACSFSTTRMRRCNVTDHPQRYRCPQCGGKLRIVAL